MTKSIETKHIRSITVKDIIKQQSNGYISLIFMISLSR